MKKATVKEKSREEKERNASLYRRRSCQRREAMAKISTSA